MRIKLIFTSLAFAALIVVAGYSLSGNSAAAALSEDNVNPHYKGGSSFNLAGVGPNVARCGAFPENVELSFTGSGIDTEGGFNTAVFSACSNTTTNEVFDLKATDTYAGSGIQSISKEIVSYSFLIRRSVRLRTRTASPSASWAAPENTPAPPAPAVFTSPAT